MKKRSYTTRKVDLVHLTSHQIYTPLTVIKGYISLIQEGTCGTIPDEAKHILKIVEESADKLVNTVKKASTMN